MTDDDIIKPGAINKILGLLRHKYSLIVLNAEVLEQTLINQLESRHLHIEADTFYESALREKFFIETVIYLSFIGAVVIERALWNERIKEPYIGTEFIHIGVIFQKDLPRGAYVLAEPCIAIRYGNAQWIPRHFEIWMIKWPDLIWSFPDIGETAKVQICPRSPWENLPALFVERACGAYSLPEYHKFLKSRIVSRRKQLAAKAIALSPGIIINLVMRLYFTIVALDNFILWHRLRTSRYYYRVYFNNIYLYLKRKFRFWGDY